MTILGENKLCSLISFYFVDDWNSYTVDNRMKDIAYEMSVLKWQGFLLSKKIDEYNL